MSLDNIAMSSCSGDGIVIQGGSAHLTQCYIAGCQYSGLVATNGAEVLLENCCVTGCLEYGISAIDTGTTVRLEDSSVVGCRVQDVLVEAGAEVVN